MQDKSGEVRIEKNKWAEQKQGVKKATEKISIFASLH